MTKDHAIKLNKRDTTTPTQLTKEAKKLRLTNQENQYIKQLHKK